MAQWSSPTLRQSRRLSQWSSQRVSRHQSSDGRAPMSRTGGNGRQVRLQMLFGTLLPRKDPEIGDDESSEDADGPDEEDEPQFLDAEEMSGGGVVLKSAYCRISSVIIDDHICQKKFEVKGRFPLLGPWWKVRVYVKRVRSMYYMKGFPSYFLQTDFGTKKEGVLPLFLKECNVPEEFKEKFFKWLPQKLRLTFHNLEDILQEFSTTMDPEKGGYDILKYVQTSCTGVNVKNALRFPLIMEYVPTLLPRIFKSLLQWEPEMQNGDDEETEEAEEDLVRHVRILTKIEEMLSKDPWKLGFGRITYRELDICRCEASLKAFQQCEPLLQKIPELQLNALIIYDQLKQRCRETGDTYVEQDILTKAACQDMPVVQAWEALEFLKQEKIVVREKDRIFLLNLYFYEVNIATCIKTLVKKDPWCLNVDVEEVLRAQQAMPAKDAVTDDTLEELSTQLYEMESQESDVRTGEVPKINCDFQDSGQETEGGGSAQLEIDPDQVRAAQMICSNPLTVISGKGGCGKTTVVSLIFKHLLSKENEEVEKACRAFESDVDASNEWFTQSHQPVEEETRKPEDMTVLLTAPTGKAASLLRKKTNLPSFTLHQITASYYQWRKSDSDKKWKFSKVKVLVVDEGSLVSVQILSSVLVLLCEYAKLAKLIILGDVRQLPSIDPGNMLADVFQSAKDIHWAIELQTNHRAESQLIVENATRISEQRFVEFDAVVEIGKQSDVTMPSSENKFILVSLPDDGNDDDLQTAVKLLLHKGPGLQDDKTSQFIAFRRVDCDLINELCCQHYSHHSTINQKNKPEFRCRDKVCCTKNAYIKDLVPSAKSDTAIKDRTLIHDEREAPLGIGERDPLNNVTTEQKTDPQSLDCKEERLCNGEVFFITADVEQDKVRSLTISDMDEREYTLDYLKLYRICKIKHAWARTIHTFQGSEEGTVVYVVGTAGRQDWQHVYTAVTRGRQRVYIVAKGDQFVKAVFNKCRPRKTRLRQRLKEKLTQRNDCAAATSSPLKLNQEIIEPYSSMISSQEEDITLLNSQETNCENNTIAIGTKALCDQNNTPGSVIVYDEPTDSDLEAAVQNLEQKQISNVIQFPQSALKTLHLERHDVSSPTRPLQQQEHEICGASNVLSGGDFVAVHGFGEWDRSPTGGGSNADSFGDLNDSELESLFHPPFCEASNNGDSLVVTSGFKRFSTEKEVAESPSKISRVTLDESPLGCTRFRDLSLTTVRPKQLF